MKRRKMVDLPVERLQRHRILASANAGFAAVKKLPTAWREELEERTGWEATLSDGLHDD
jgi:hypothetical protein